MFALTASACAEPLIQTVEAPATVTPTPAPTPSPAPTVANQPTPTPFPFVGEPGITVDSLRVGVIYDVGVDPVTDQLSQSALEAVEAWAASVNRENGITNKMVEVVPIETRPLLEDHAEAIDRACNSNVFALIGSSALFDGLGLDQLQAPTCNLPDFPAVVASPERLGSEVTTVSNPVESDLWQAGWARYYAESRPELAAAAASVLLDFDPSVISGERMTEAATAQGLDFVAQLQYTFDSDFSAEVTALTEAGAGLVIWRNGGGALLRLLAAYRDAEVERPAIVCSEVCYSDVWLEAAGPLADGVSVWLPHRQLEEASDTFELSRYQFWLGSTHGLDTTATSTGIMAWASALLFEEAVGRATRSGTDEYDANNLTRAGVIEAASTITGWDARGLHGTADPANMTPSPCFVLLTFTDGAWQRTFPLRSGEFDCAPANLVELTITPGLGSPTPTPTPGGEGDGGDEEGAPSADTGAN